MVSPELLSRFPFFDFMGEMQLHAITTIAEIQDFKKDELIVESGQPANAFFFLIEGSVAYYYVVTTDNDPYYKAEYHLSDINSGEVFGISALIEPYLYTASLRADKPSRVIKIDAPALRTLCNVDPTLAYGLMRSVAKAAMERLETTRIHLAAARVVA